MASQALIGRLIRVTVKPKDGDGFLIDGHDIAFDVDKTSEPEPNKAKITIYNLEERLRGQLQLKDDSSIVVEAGYEKTIASIFEGNITHAISGEQGPDIVTVIDAAEAHKVHRTSVVSKTYGKGAKLSTVIEDIIKTFAGFKITPAITSTLSAIKDTLPNSLTLDGPSAKVLTDVLRQLGLGFSIQNGQIQILAGCQGSDQPVVQLNYATGLVGIPQVGEKKESGRATIDFQSLLQPELVPGRQVFVDWIERKGLCVCDNVKHKGDNFGSEFYSNVKACMP